MFDHFQDEIPGGGMKSLLAFVRGMSPVAWYRRGVGMAVGQWDDVSGNSRHFTQATATNQLAVQADGSLLADGADNYMSATFTLPQPYTIGMLFNPVSWTATDQLLTGSGATTFFRQITGSPQHRWAAGTSLSAMSPTIGAINATLFVGNGTSSVARLNAGAEITGDAGTGAFSNPVLAASATPSVFANAAYYELVFFGSALDAAARGKLMRYLSIVGQLGL